MRLDKLLGKAAGELKIKVSDYHSGETLFFLNDWYEYSALKEDMKNYKVTYFDIDIDNNSLIVLAKKKED